MKNDILGLYVLVILTLIVSVGFGAYGFTSSANHFVQTSTSATTTAKTNQLTISASGTVYNSSSQANLYLTINGTGQTNSQAVQNLSATLEKFNSTILKYVGENISRITTSSFQVYKPYNKTYYIASESVSVTIPQIANTSAAIGAISNLSNVYVGSAQPQLSNAQISAMRTAALAQAMANATSQADAVINKNDTIEVTNITIDNYRIYPVYATGVANAAGVSGGGSAAVPASSNITTQFYGGTNQVSESITVQFSWYPK